MELKENCNVIINENYRGSADETFFDKPPLDVVKMREKIGSESGSNVKLHANLSVPKTSYIETLIHLFKGNVGPGCFAMACAIKNGGIILGPILTLLLGIICVHVMHILLKCSAMMKERFELETHPDYAETVELVFATSNNAQWRKLAKAMKAICNTFICITQLGFCCIYFLFIGTNLEQVLGFYGFKVNLYTIIILILIPIWLSALITNLKFLAPCSGLASVCMIVGLIISYYYSLRDLPPISTREFIPTDFRTLPLFFGTAIFAFEGIALVLPLKNAMKKPEKFSCIFGVLNVGMVVVTGLFISFGTIGYWKYGENTAASLTLNLPTDEKLAQSVKLAIATGVLLGYALQFFIAIQIMLPNVQSMSRFAREHPLLGELLFRTAMVLITFAVAILIPELDLLLSLIGSVCSTVLALVLPPIMEFIILSCEEKPNRQWVTIKNFFILMISLLGFLTGGYESLTAILRKINY